MSLPLRQACVEWEHGLCVLRGQVMAISIQKQVQTHIVIEDKINSNLENWLSN